MARVITTFWCCQRINVEDNATLVVRLLGNYTYSMRVDRQSYRGCLPISAIECSPVPDRQPYSGFTRVGDPSQGILAAVGPLRILLRRVSQKVC